MIYIISSYHRTADRNNALVDTKLSQQKLHEIVAEHLTEMILSGHLRSGELLPTERELVERLNVSRGVIREATKLLEAKGLVQVRPGRGVTVIDPSTEHLAKSIGIFLRRSESGLGNLVELRQCIEVEAAGLAAIHASEDQIRNLRTLLTRTDQHLGNHDIFIDGDMEFHSRITVATGNPLFVSVLDALSEALKESRQLSIQIKDGPDRAQSMHWAIYDAISQHDKTAAENRMQAHIQQTRKDLAEVIQAKGMDRQINPARIIPASSREN